MWQDLSGDIQNPGGICLVFFPRRKHKKVLTVVKGIEDWGVGWGVVGWGGKPVLYILHFSELFIFSNNIYSPLSLSTGVI